MAQGKIYEPTQKDRDEVAALIGMGLTAEQVATVKAISRETLHKKHQEDIDRGRPMALAKVVDTAFKMATSGKHPASTMFWLKCQAGWKEKPDMATPAALENAEGILDKLNKSASAFDVQSETTPSPDVVE